MTFPRRGSFLHCRPLSSGVLHFVSVNSFYWNHVMHRNSNKWEWFLLFYCKTSHGWEGWDYFVFPVNHSNILWGHVCRRGQIAVSSECVTLPHDAAWAAVWTDVVSWIYMSKRKHVLSLTIPGQKKLWWKFGLVWGGIWGRPTMSSWTIMTSTFENQCINSNHMIVTLLTSLLFQVPLFSY